uniref:O-acyl-ADP-ribose deacylase 1 n=1 Tax=Acanthochromis polyacanthus TaxID=80966 RepID=A0A3Q1GHI1_9TELE
MSSKLQSPASIGQMKHVKDSWRMNYVTGDLFSCPEDEALAHCISEDCRMGAGIAVLFKQKFKGVSELKEQKRETGQCAVLMREGRFVYYLITKKRAFQKPTYTSLKQSLEDMRSHCVKNGVRRISMPRFVSFLVILLYQEIFICAMNLFCSFLSFIFALSPLCQTLSCRLLLSDSIGCGLDRLEWAKVSVILEQIFKHTNISITVYSLPQKTETTVMKGNLCR